MKVGTLFKWQNFPSPQFGGKKKPRLFVYLGDTGLLESPTRAYIHTTTTNLGNPGNKIFFSAKKYNFFDQDCYLYYNEPPYTINKSTLKNNPKIEILGRLSEQVLKNIYNGILKSYKYSKIQILDIHASFNKDGITGLKKP